MFILILYQHVSYPPPSMQQIVHPFIAYQQERRGQISQDKFAMFDQNRFPRIVNISFIKAITDTYSYLIPRVAFFDKRTRGRYKNATVILTHITKKHPIVVVACIVNGHYMSKVEVKSISLNKWIHQHHPECTHDDVVILCFDTPGRNNSKVSVVYENPIKFNTLEFFVTESEYPLFIPKSRETAKTFSSSIMVCTTVYGSPPYFGAWLRYQKTLGVDLVYINVVKSFLSSQAYNDSFFQESVRNGFVQLEVWKEHLKPGALFYHSQGLYYQNCLYRFQGVYNYAIMADVDDFVISREGEIQQLLPDIFNNLDPKTGKLGSIRLVWIRYFEPKSGFNFTVIADGNLTQYVNVSQRIFEPGNKSIHKLSATSEVGVHEVTEQMQGYKWTTIPRRMLYMAHIKKPRNR